MGIVGCLLMNGRAEEGGACWGERGGDQKVATQISAIFNREASFNRNFDTTNKISHGTRRMLVIVLLNLAQLRLGENK